MEAVMILPVAGLMLPPRLAGAGLPPAEAPPLMGLTAQKPIVLVTQAGDRLDIRRWSFCWHGFVRDGTRSAAPPCTPAPP